MAAAQGFGKNEKWEGQTCQGCRHLLSRIFQDLWTSCEARGELPVDISSFFLSFQKQLFPDTGAGASARTLSQKTVHWANNQSTQRQLAGRLLQITEVLTCLPRNSTCNRGLIYDRHCRISLFLSKTDLSLHLDISIDIFWEKSLWHNIQHVLAGILASSCKMYPFRSSQLNQNPEKCNLSPLNLNLGLFCMTFQTINTAPKFCCEGKPFAVLLPHFLVCFRLHNLSDGQRSTTKIWPVFQSCSTLIISSMKKQKLLLVYFFPLPVDLFFRIWTADPSFARPFHIPPGEEPTHILYVELELL